VQDEGGRPCHLLLPPREEVDARQPLYGDNGFRRPSYAVWPCEGCPLRMEAPGWISPCHLPARTIRWLS